MSYIIQNNHSSFQKILLLWSVISLFSLTYFRPCSCLIQSRSPSDVTIKSLLILRRSSKNFSGWSTSLVNFTYFCFSEVLLDFSFDLEVFKDFWLDLWTFEEKRDLVLELLFFKSAPWGLPKSGISKVRSYNCANSKFVNKF